MRRQAQPRNPYSRWWLWIPGSLVALAPRNAGRVTAHLRFVRNDRLASARQKSSSGSHLKAAHCVRRHSSSVDLRGTVSVRPNDCITTAMPLVDVKPDEG